MNHSFNLAVQRACIWSIIPFVVIYLIGFAGFAHFVPPPSPSMPEATLSAFYAHNRQGIEIGQLIGLFGSAFMLTWPAAVSAQMAEIPGAKLLAIMQYVAAALLALLFILCGIVWAIAAYRPGLNPDLLRLMNDSGWLIFVMGFPEYLVQLGAIAVAGLADRRPDRFLPQWACYATILTAIIGTGGGFAGLCHGGWFAWNGAIGFWLPVVDFLVWMLVVILPFTLRSIARQAA